MILCFCIKEFNMVISIFIQANIIEEKSGILGSSGTIRVDSRKLNDDLQLKLLELDEDGYKIISITPITSGQYVWNSNGVGFSYTDGLIVVAQK